MSENDGNRPPDRDQEQAAGTEVKRSPQASFSPGDGGQVRIQCGALCWRRGPDGVQVLLVTSRDTGRWVIPKGWAVPGLTPAESAAREAWEEAGVRGTVMSQCLGVYSYDKVLDRSDDMPVTVPCIVSVYPIATARCARDYPEADERRQKWVSRAKAARKVDEPELAALIAAFDPDALATAP